MQGNPPPQDQVPNCLDPSDESNTFFSETAGEPPSVSPSSKTEALAVGERLVPRGENPPHSDMKKESLEWQMASESRLLNFFPERMFVISLVETIKAAPADVKAFTKIQQLVIHILPPKISTCINSHIAQFNTT